MTLTEIKIKGMHCNSCVILIEAALKEMDAISNVQISYQNGNALIEYDEDKIDVNEIEKTIRNEGFEV